MNLDDMDDEEKMRLFEQLFMGDIEGTNGLQGIHLNNVDPSQDKLFEQLMREIILPQLLLGGELGGIEEVKIMRMNGGKEKIDYSWLDKYLK